MRHHPFLLLAFGLFLSAGVAKAQTDVGTMFVPTTRSETLSAPLAGGAVLSAASYSGLVRLAAR